MTSNSTRSHLMVADSAAILKRFYFLQCEFVYMQAGWTPNTEHWEAKLLLPESLWKDALIAQQLRGRVLELRYPDSRMVPGTDEPLIDSWRKMRDAPNAAAFIAGYWQEIKPAMRAAFACYLDVADHLDDGPTIRILKQAIEDIDEELARWNPILDEARRLYPESQPALKSWVDALHGWLRKTGLRALLEPLAEGIEAFEPLKAGGKDFAISRTGVRDRRFNHAWIPWPDSLDPSRGPGVGFELQVRQAQAHLNEIWAAEMAAAVIFDLAKEAPPEFLQDAARWCYDEVRHCRMGYTRFLEWGFQKHEMPLGSFSYDAGAEHDALVRLGIIFYFETTYINTKSARTKSFAEFGDRTSSHDMDFDWADELIHTFYGKKWLQFFLEQRGETRSIAEIKALADESVQKLRARATPEDRAQTEEVYENTMRRARELALAKAAT